jgi:hypothetical protein
VLVYRKRTGDDELVGSDRTNDHGGWSLDVERAHGRFYAKVERWQPDLSLDVCRADTSRTIRVE